MSQLNKLVISLLIIKLLAVSCAVGILFSKRQEDQLPKGAKWEKDGDRFYNSISKDEVNWEDAQNACLKINATLVIDNDPQVRDYLISWEHPMWLGAKQNDDDDGLSWIDGSPVNNNPNNWTKRQHKKNENKLCLSLSLSGSWRLESCMTKHYFLCQFIQGLKPKPTSPKPKPKPISPNPTYMTDAWRMWTGLEENCDSSPKGNPCVTCTCKKVANYGRRDINSCREETKYCDITPCTDSVQKQGECCPSCPNGPNCLVYGSIVKPSKKRIFKAGSDSEYQVCSAGGVVNTCHITTTISDFATFEKHSCE